MKKYYLHNGSENIGPFDIEGLKEKKITRDTPIWCEGMNDWKNANGSKKFKHKVPNYSYVKVLDRKLVMQLLINKISKLNFRKIKKFDYGY